MAIADPVIARKRYGHNRTREHSVVDDPRTRHHLAEPYDRYLRRINDSTKRVNAALTKTRDSDRRISDLGAADAAGPHPCNQIAHRCHECITRKPVRIMDCGRSQTTTPNGDRHAWMNAGRWLELTVNVKSVKGGKATDRQSNGLHRNCAHKQPAFRRTRRIHPRKPSLARCHVNLMLEIIVWNFTLRTCHGGRYRHAHCVEVEAFG